MDGVSFLCDDLKASGNFTYFLMYICLILLLKKLRLGFMNGEHREADRKQQQLSSKSSTEVIAMAKMQHCCLLSQDKKVSGFMNGEHGGGGSKQQQLSSKSSTAVIAMAKSRKCSIPVFFLKTKRLTRPYCSFKNRSLSQKLEAQKLESALENKFSLRKTKQHMTDS